MCRKAKFQIGDKVEATFNNQSKEGIITIIDTTHPLIAYRIKVTKGDTAMTDFYEDDLKLL